MAAASFLGSTIASFPKVSEYNGQQPTSSQARLIVKASKDGNSSKKQTAVGVLAAVLIGGMISANPVAIGEAKATLLDDLLAKTAANKELDEKKRLASSEANFARAYTVEFNTCKFPENFTGCQDLAKRKYVKFLSDDLKLECEGKEKHQCVENVFWKWGK